VSDAEKDLIVGMLMWNPKNRITIATALANPLFEAYARPASAPRPYPAISKAELADVQVARGHIWSMFLRSHPEVVELTEALKPAAAATAAAAAA